MGERSEGLSNIGAPRVDDRIANLGSYANPLFLANSNNPGMQLTTLLFNGSNFQNWCRSVRMALGAKMKLGFITGSCPKPLDSSPDYERWIRNDYMIMCWLVNSMIAEVAENFMCASSAKELWDEIIERYGQSNGPLIYQLRKDLSNITQGNLSIATYFSKMKKIWDELLIVDGIPKCSCGVLTQCSCGLMRNMLQRDARSKVIQFLMGLNDDFENVRSNILSMDPIPNLNKAYQMVTQIEKQKQVTASMNPLIESNALNVNRQNNFRSTGNKRDSKKGKFERRCDYCNEKGHLRDQCFKLIGYPEWCRGPKGKSSDKMVAHVADMAQSDTPLENAEEPKPNQVLVNAVFHEVMKMMKGKNTADNCTVDMSLMNNVGPFN